MLEWLSCANYYEKRIGGSCEDITSVPPMRYTKGPIPSHACCVHALQIFWVQVAEAKNGIEWPLHVYGWVATRDSVDCKRNFLFNRTRDKCQILTQQDPYLLLTGPSCAVVLIDPVTFQMELKVKGHGQIIFQGRIVCHTTSIDEGAVVLLDSRDGRMPINCGGTVELSRRVVSVEVRDQLKVDVATRTSDNSDVVKGRVVFTNQENDSSCSAIDLGFCKVEVIVAWSLLSCS